MENSFILGAFSILQWAVLLYVYFQKMPQKADKDIVSQLLFDLALDITKLKENEENRRIIIAQQLEDHKEYVRDQIRQAYGHQSRFVRGGDED